MRAVQLAAVVAVAAATAGRHIPERKELLSMLSPAGAVPQGVPADFECGWRGLAFEFAQQLQPFRPASAFADVFDGLQLASLCNQTMTLARPQQPAVAAPLRAAATTVYVDAVGGNDGNAGTEVSPFQHLAFAVAAVRSMPQPATVLLRGAGVHRLTATLQLTAQDSGLTIAAYPGETPVVSSGQVIAPTWTPVAPAPAPASRDCVWKTYAATDAMYNDWPNANVQNVSSMPSQAACLSACQGSTTCHGWIWYDPAGAFGGQWDGMCFLRTDTAWPASAQDNTFSGRCETPPPPPNVFVADLAAAGTPLPASVTAAQSSFVTLFFSADGGRTTQRAFRARYPNADLETDLFPKGWASGGKRLPPAYNENTTLVTTPLPNNYGPGMFSDYFFGVGGPCDRFGEGDWNAAYGPSTISYWCQPYGRVANGTYFVRSPAGIVADTTLLPNSPYASDITSNGATVQYWRNGHWFSMAVRPDNVTVDAATNASTIGWSYGAFQGAEGDESGEDWYIDHVQEELDAPREFYFDAASQKLYFNMNATVGVPPPPSWTWEVPMLACLINISGTPANPVTGISITGITFTGAAASIMMAHGIPTGGDWGLARIGAIRIEGASGVSITQSTFSRLDGSAVSINGWARNTTFDSNECVWLGESCVASWGRTDGVDATAGTQPFGTRVTNNLCHEIGHYEKQVSCYFAATSGQSTIANNIFYNMPRAAINFNDDMAGGSLMTRNLVWATCRESQDHGPFNSWGRVPFLINWPNGTVSPGMKPQFDELSFNFIVAGGGANGGSFDHDDGSSFYHDHDNFEVYGGHKSDFDGHAKQSYNNVMAFANVYGSRCLSIMNLPHASPNAYFAEGFVNNTCILTNSGDVYLDLGSCTSDSTLPNRMLLGNNRVMVPGSMTSVTCGKTYSFSDWMALGYDAGTTISDVPTTADIIAMGRAVLQMT